MNIAIFSGSFNPVHVGHTILGEYVSQFTDTDQVWYLLTPHNPLKPAEGLLNAERRLAMLQLALTDFPQLEASDFEFSMPQPNYTYRTLDALQQCCPQHRFRLLIGSDNWQIIDRWKRWQYLIERYGFLVYPRPGYETSIAEQYAEKVQMLHSPQIEISSTFVRQCLQSGKSVRAMLAPAVFNYIQKERLWQRGEQ